MKEVVRFPKPLLLKSGVEPFHERGLSNCFYLHLQTVLVLLPAQAALYGVPEHKLYIIEKLL